MQLGDVKKTFADIDKSKIMLDFNPSTNIELELVNLLIGSRFF